MHIRPYEIDDEASLVKLWNLCLTAHPLSAEAWRHRVLLDPNFCTDGALVALQGKETAGFVLAIARRVDWWDYSLQKDRGWITALFVSPRHRRRGIGSALLQRALDYLREHGRKLVIVADYSPSFFLPGVPAGSYPGAAAFFLGRGFHTAGKAVAMEATLRDYVTPPGIMRRETELQQQGILVGYFEPRWILPALAFFRSCFPHWTYYFRQKMSRQDAHDEMVIATLGDRVIGYCQQLAAEHVGPFGADPQYQRQGVGSVMLHRLLSRMHEKEYHCAWFGMTERAQSYYARAGFQVTEEYFLMHKEI